MAPQQPCTLQFILKRYCLCQHTYCLSAISLYEAATSIKVSQLLQNFNDQLLSTHLIFCFYLSIYMYLSINLSIYLPIYLYLHVYIYQSIYLCSYVSHYMYMYMSLSFTRVYLLFSHRRLYVYSIITLDSLLS